MQRDMQCDMRDMQLVYAIGHARVGTWETCNVPRHAHNALSTIEPGRAPRVDYGFHVPREPDCAPYDEGTIIRSHPLALFASTLYMA